MQDADGNVVTDVAADAVATLAGGNNLTLVGLGTVTITATQVGNADYATATQTQTITVSAVPLTDQTITFTTPITSPATGNVGVPIILAATAGPGLDVTFEITAETRLGAPVPARTVATLESDGVTLNLVGAGTVVITARQAGGDGTDGNIYAAATNVEQTINVSPGTQVITFTTPATSPATSTVGTMIELEATSSAGLDVTFEITEVQDADDNVVTDVAADAVATLADGSTTLHLTGVGTVEVTAKQGGDVNYNPATVEQTITVLQGTQDITFMSDDAGDVGTDIDLVATASSGLDVTFGITEVQDVDGNVVTGPAADAVATLAVGSTTLRLTGVGTVEVTATQAGNANYEMTTEMQTITVSQGSQVITFTTPATSSATSTVGTTIELAATGGGSGNPVSFSIPPGENPGNLKWQYVDTNRRRDGHCHRYTSR